MRLKLMYLFATLSTLLFASPLVAQGGAVAEPIKLGAVAMGIASGICGIGQGLATKGAAEGVARNPGAVAHVRFALILGLVFIESLALYTFALVLMGK